MIVDGYVFAVPEEKREEFIKIARLSAEVYRDHGAMRVVECWGREVRDGEVTSFPKAVKAKPGEVVIFSYAEFPDRAARDACMEAAEKDPRMDIAELPFDGQRMIYGIFDAVVEL